MTYHINLQHRRGVKVLKTDNTSNAIRQNIGSSLITVNGSTIAYTPLAGSSYVIYEFVSQFQERYWFNNAHFRLRMGDTASSLSSIATNDIGYRIRIGADKKFSEGNAENVRYRQQLNLRFAISTSGWTSEKYVGLKAQCDPWESSSSDSYINGLSFSPFVIIYCI